MSLLFQPRARGLIGALYYAAMNHITEAQQFDRATLTSLFAQADKLSSKRQYTEPLRGKILASLFYEPSTRTRFSFESAMLRLGGEVLSTENAGEFSSAAKGETLEDTIRIIQSYSDVIVLRHPEKGATDRATSVAEVPIINAGDGAGQHPTQALLDLYTIQKECGHIDGSSIAFAGDLKHGRTVRSLVYLLGKYKNITMHFVSPKELRIGDDIKEYLARHKVQFEEHLTWEKIINSVDVLYQTRIQKERFASLALYKKVKGKLILTLDTVNCMHKKAIVMHPLPRVDEITPEVDASPKAVYFKQAKYGLLVRMALLLAVLEKK